MTATTTPYLETNQRYLVAEVARVKALLESFVFPEKVVAPSKTTEPFAADAIPTLEILVRTFGLSPFECDVLVLCAGVELDSSFTTLLASANADPLKTYPTFSLALALLSEAHWSALSPTAPLRYWRLVELSAGPNLTQCALKLDERILHFLTGVQTLDERLLSFVKPCSSRTELVPSQHHLAEKMVGLWSRAAPSLPSVQLCGADAATRQALAVEACASLGLRLYFARANALPVQASDLETFVRLWQREAVLNGVALLLECDDIEKDTNSERVVNQLLESLNAPLVVSCPQGRTLETMTLELQKPSKDEQRQLWGHQLGDGLETSELANALASQFDLEASMIHSVGRENSTGDASTINLHSLRTSCQRQTRSHLDALAQRIETRACWDDLVLPETQRELLREVALHTRHLEQVYETWGFAHKTGRGMGISALFAGPSGTGKTFAAEVLANELQLDLYRIDLSQVVSKYIGETEKNLRRVFDAAERGGVVLLFDEADALFGKRSEVKDSHDRYANLEVSYLLQRMESFRGLAILTTNFREALDTAFLRRIRFVVTFPFPANEERAALWNRIFPKETPTLDLAMAKLARLNITGGNIHNVAMYSAFLAAEENAPVQMKHLLRATRVEYGKLERPLSESEIGDWL
jgi:ATPase family associated with various cellular activities (AAA)